MARLGLLTIGMILLHRSSDIWGKIGPASSDLPFFTVCVWICLLGGLGFMASAFLSSKPSKLSPILLVVVLFSQWALHSAFVATESSNIAPSDTVVLSLEAAVVDWLGENPYGYPMVDVLSAYESTGQSSTPHLDGGQVERLPYPPLHFWVLKPILAWGLEGARALYSLAFSGLLLTVFLYSRPAYRAVVMIPMLANPELLHFPLYWASDTIWVLLLALMLWNWKHPIVRGVLLGLACAYKQTPWLFAPFLAVRILKEEARPLRAFFLFLGVSIGTFATVNLPYLWADPRAWFQGTFDPMLSPYVPLGRGLSMVMQTNLLPFAKSYFSLLTLATFVLSVWFYFLNYRRLRPLLWWFPALVLFFSYRSLPHYFVYSVPLLTMEFSRFEDRELVEPYHRSWFLPLLAWLLVFLSLTAVYWPSPPTVAAEIVSRQTTQIEIDVTNNSPQAFQPNFFARTDWRVFPWVILKGPLILGSGETARYTVGTDLSYRGVSQYSAGQIVVSDGHADLGYRAIVDLPVQPSTRYPRGFEGPQSDRWVRTGDVRVEGAEVRFSTQGGSEMATATRQMSLPFGELSFALFRPPDFPQSASFGLEVRDASGRRLSVLLGDSASQGRYQPNHFYKVLESSPGWNSYTLDLRSLYLESGFPLPSLDRFVSRDVELVDRPITLSFVLYSTTPVKDVAVRDVRLERAAVPGHRIADVLGHHREYQSILGDFAARRRRFEEALDLYEQAWPLKPSVRTTQEGGFLAIPRPHTFEGRFPLAGSGWAEPKSFPGGVARPTSDEESTIKVLARPGLELELKFYPPTTFRYRWGEEDWHTAETGEAFSVPDPPAIRTLTVVPKNEAALQAIVAR